MMCWGNKLITSRTYEQNNTLFSSMKQKISLTHALQQIRMISKYSMRYSNIGMIFSRTRFELSKHNNMFVIILHKSPLGFIIQITTGVPA